MSIIIIWLFFQFCSRGQGFSVQVNSKPLAKVQLILSKIEKRANIWHGLLIPQALQISLSFSNVLLPLSNFVPHSSNLVPLTCTASYVNKFLGCIPCWLKPLEGVFQSRLLNDKFGAGTKVGLDQLGSLTSDQAKNGFVSHNYLPFAPMSPRLA